MQTKMISFAARHPEMPGFEYKIGSMRLRLVGIDNNVKTINGNSVTFTEEQVKKLKYLIIEGADVNTAHKNFEIQKQLVVQINM